MKRAFTLLLVILLAIVAGAALYVRGMIRNGFGARGTPSALETVIARRMRDAAIPASYRDAANPWTNRATPDVMAEARRHFADHCAQCHANDGSGQSEMGPGLYPQPPDLRLAATQQLTDGQLYAIIENGVRLSGMPAFGDAGDGLGDDDSWKLALFVRHLPQLTPGEMKDMQDYNPAGKFDEEYEHEGAGHHHH